MNRLFGVRNVGAGDFPPAFIGDQGHSGEMVRSAAGDARRPTVRSGDSERGLGWSAGAHVWRETGDGGSLGRHHPQHRLRHNHPQRASDEPLLRAATRQQENIPVAGGEATWSNHASGPSPLPPALKLGEEDTTRHAQTRPTLGGTSTLSSSRPPPPPPTTAAARQEGPRNAAPTPVMGCGAPALAATPGGGPSSKYDEDSAGDAGEERRSERPPPPSPSLSAEPPLATDSLDLAKVSTPGSHATGASAAAAPASSASQGAHSPAVAGIGHDAIVPRRSAAVVQPESASLLEERALEVSEPPADRSAVCAVAA